MEHKPVKVLKDIARHVIDHGRSGTMEYADHIMKLPASVYYDPALFDLEMERIFKRMPIILGPSCELPKPGDYKTMRVAKTSILLVRGKDNIMRGFINACRHRGAELTSEPCGNQARFTCPFHGWSFGLDGRLLAIAAQQDFGSIDKADYGLKEFPVAERAGLIWGIINPNSKLDIDTFLVGYEEMLACFGFSDWKFFSKRQFSGPNWKLSFDGYLEYYHVPTLHGQTFGPDSTNRALYYAWGPHQHIKTPDLTKDHIATETLGYLARLLDKDEADWDLETLIYGVWTVFPCISIASFNGGGRGVMVSQVLPGDHVGTSTTTQYYLMKNLPDDPKASEDAEAQFAFLQQVVENEDIAQAFSAQRTLPASGIDHVLLGRNEQGNQHFHSWCQKLVEAETDEDLVNLFRHAARAEGVPQ